jgi:GNAT superfamily N-acetyltransferase
VAQQVHRVLTQAYTQEAQLLGLPDFRPLQRSVADLQADTEAYLGAFVQGELAGALAFGPDPEGGQLLVSLLVVAPAFQRRGVARALMARVLKLAGPWPVAVATAQANTPAVLLYQGLGFQAYRQGTVGPDALPITKFRYPAGMAASVAMPSSPKIGNPAPDQPPTP